MDVKNFRFKDKDGNVLYEFPITGVAPDITVTASVDNNVGVPSVAVTKTGENDAPTYQLDFKNLKGDTGPQGVQGPKGDTGLQGPPVTLDTSVSTTSHNGVENQAITNYVNNLSSLVSLNGIAHNTIYRGKNLGSAVTAAQYAAISAGTFEELYIGDYWTIGGVNYRIAAFDYYWNCGDNAVPPHHAVIVPDTCLYNAVMNTSDTTAGGYVGSQMYTTNLEQAKTTIKGAFSGHVMNHRIYAVNAVANGYSSGGAWVDSEVDLMNEQMVYGCGIFSPVSTGSAVPANYRVEKSQLPLFAHDPSRITNQVNYWLRDVITASHFALTNAQGYASYGGTSGSQGVRPAFCIS